MKKQILIASAMLISLPFYGQTPITYHNADGSLNTWYLQDDIFSFRCKGGTALGQTCDANIVQNLTY